MSRVQQNITPEFKSLPMQTKVIDGRTVTTLFSVFGIVDSYGDRVWPGAFANTFAQRGQKVLHLWQHDFESPPIAVVKTLREIPREELPESTLRDYPEALGGAEATSDFLDTPRANEVLSALQAGSPLQASFGYDALRFDFTQEDDDQIRNLREVRLWELSTVLWGANSAALGSKSAFPLDVLLKNLNLHIAAIKTGARHTDAEFKLLNIVHKAIVELGATNCMGLIEDDAGDDAAKNAERASKFQALIRDRKTHTPISVSGLWLRSWKNTVQVLAEVDGAWRLAIDTLLNSTDTDLISHIAEPLGIQSAPADTLTTPADKSRAEPVTVPISLTLMKHQRQTLDLLDFIGV